MSFSFLAKFNVTKLFKLLFPVRRYVQFLKNLVKYWYCYFWPVKELDKLIDRHFKIWSEVNHINKDGLKLAIEQMPQDEPFIFETGSSAYGTNSSRLFDSVVQKLGGNFHSTDISSKPSRSLKFQHSKRTQLHICDSVQFIRNQLNDISDKVDLCYLDSFDVDWLNPLPSAEHGLREYLQIRPFLQRGSVLVVDDTPAHLRLIPENYHTFALSFQELYGVLPGKGAFIFKIIKSTEPEKIIHHDYNLVIKF
jgi:hypothetical protein